PRPPDPSSLTGSKRNAFSGNKLNGKAELPSTYMEKDPLVFSVPCRSRIISGSDRILADDPVIAAHGGQFSTTLVLQHLARRFVGIALRVVQRGRFVGVIALVDPLAIVS